MKTIFIVEDNNDEHTFSAIIRYIKADLPNFRPIGNIDWKFAPKDNNSNKPTSLINALKPLRNEFNKKTYDKVGIIIDMDSSIKKDLLNSINNALLDAYGNHVQNLPKLTDTDKLVAFDIFNIKVHFACHFVNLDGKGEIEDILKAIKKQDSPVADCVNDHLPKCLELKSEELRDKDLVKLWINNYQRYDTLVKDQRNETNTKWASVMGEKRANELFDFNADLQELNELKKFLQMMTTL